MTIETQKPITAQHISFQEPVGSLVSESYDDPVLQGLLGGKDPEAFKSYLEQVRTSTEQALKKDPDGPCLALDILLQCAYHENAEIRKKAGDLLGDLSRTASYRVRLAEDAVRTMVSLDKRISEKASVAAPPTQFEQLVQWGLDKEQANVVWDRLKDLRRNGDVLLTKCQSVSDGKPLSQDPVGSSLVRQQGIQPDISDVTMLVRNQILDQHGIPSFVPLQQIQILTESLDFEHGFELEEKLDRPLEEEQGIGDFYPSPDQGPSDPVQFGSQSPDLQPVKHPDRVKTESAPQMVLPELHKQIEEKQNQIEEIAKPYKKFEDEVKNLRNQLKESRKRSREKRKALQESYRQKTVPRKQPKVLNNQPKKPRLFQLHAPKNAPERLKIEDSALQQRINERSNHSIAVEKRDNRTGVHKTGDQIGARHENERLPQVHGNPIPPPPPGPGPQNENISPEEREERIQNRTDHRAAKRKRNELFGGKHHSVKIGPSKPQIGARPQPKTTNIPPPSFPPPPLDKVNTG